MNTYRKQSSLNSPQEVSLAGSAGRRVLLIFHSSIKEFSMSGNSSYLTLNLAICSFNSSPLKLSPGISLTWSFVPYRRDKNKRLSWYSSLINCSKFACHCYTKPIKKTLWYILVFQWRQVLSMLSYSQWSKLKDVYHLWRNICILYLK